MSTKVAMIHTVSSLVTVFEELTHEILSDVELIHIVDGAVLKMVSNSQGLNPVIFRRVSEDVVAMENAGAEIVLLTCSSISPCADVANKLSAIPVMKIDQPMIDKAISIGRQIGVAATAKSTLGPTVQLIKDRAELQRKEIKVDPYLCEGAFEALQENQKDKHDAIVMSALEELMVRNDVVILAQASMARVVDQMDSSKVTKPVLSSPKYAVEEIKTYLNKK